jgi:DNA ligase-3
MKKDYLYGGAMADSADLVVLGAWFGTGQKGMCLKVTAVFTHSDPGV